MPINVLGSELIDCSLDPLTGFYRDGCCNTGADDFGVHTVCAIVTDEFLEFSKKAGNDLSTPRNGFPNLKMEIAGVFVLHVGKRLTKLDLLLK